ncbi:MAG: LysM peptidoglycan-binding domain-containing protein [Acidobacteria bacterium]|nr:LysM peptidoglycan-binding domain-containing protein [Acidobacteriota bacterium]
MHRSRIAWTTCLCGAAFAPLLLFTIPSPAVAGPPPAAQTDDSPQPDALLPVDDLSPGLLGMYRKTMEIEDDIRRFTEQYGVDLDLARAVCLHESGGNGNLSSHAGARGYFQVMPATFRSLRVETNIEAGIKYLSQMIRQFGREDYALGAYNAGPGRVRRGRPPLETLQYILAVGQYRNTLMLHERSIRHYASQMQLATVRGGDDWWSLSRRLGIPLVQLRMHNPFLATRALREGQLIAYPPAPRSDLLAPRGNGYVEYRTRHGDNILHIALVLEADRDKFREENRLWRLQTLPAGQALQIPLARERQRRAATTYRVQAGDDVGAIARRHNTSAWRIIRDNGLWDERLTPGATLRIEREPPRPAHATHRVRSGDTLGGLARRYGTSVRAIQAANNMGRNTVISIGQRLRMPTSPAAEVASNAEPPPPSASAAERAPEPRASAVSASPPPSPAASAATHRVVRGDNLTDLARRYGTTVRAIQSANDMGRRTTIQIGQSLRMPPSPSASAAVVTHRVQRGDTLGKIAERYGTSVRAIQAANNMGRRTVINVGQRLRIPN